MPGFENTGKMFLVIGGIMILAGAIILLISKTGLRRLPGDILIKRENVTIFFPLASMLIISILLTVVLNIWRRI